MSYHRSNSALGVTKAQQQILIDIPEEDLRALSPAEKLDLVLRRQEVKASESAAFWDALSTAVTVAAPLAAILGISLSRRGK